MKNLIQLLLLFVITLGFSQHSSKIKNNIDKYHQNDYTFKTYNILSSTDNILDDKLKKSVSDASIFNMNEEVIHNIYQDKPLLIKLSIPFKGNIIEVELYRKNVLEKDFKAFDHNKNELQYKSGVFYRGIVKDSQQSIASFSFFNNSLFGIFSTLELGNVNVGKLKNSNQYIAYAEQDLTGKNPFVCGIDDAEQNFKGNNQDLANNSTSTTNCVRIYYEVAYEPYLQNNSDVNQTINWITAIHNNISTLYANDGINIALSEVMVWTQQDPYVYDYSNNLSLFSNTRNYFNGDLAHLINQPSTTSVAYLNSLCQQNNYAYSAVEQFYNQVPTYSWTIGASTHEMGHSFGSPHTHQCLWNGNNTPIDGCGTLAGVNEQYTNCQIGSIPQNGGTIMSYCHLNSVGVNLSLGFGPQPSQLIRNTIDSKSCLGTDCINSCFRSIEDITLSNITTNSATIHIQDQISTEWKYKLYTYPGNSFFWNAISTSSFNIENLQPNTYYEVSVGNACESGTTIGIINRLLLTDGNYCDEDTFTDTGSNSGNYGDNQYLVKTFYPSNNNEKIQLDFLEFFTEEDFDFMTIYDGTSTNSSVFTNGHLSGNLTSQALSFTATNPDGAITIKFTSDTYVNESGWEAEISCLPANLSADNFDRNNVKIYPNPTQSNFTIDSKQEISQVIVYDLSGRKVIERTNINELNTTINIENLSNGAYFVHINSSNTTQTFKVIKN